MRPVPPCLVFTLAELIELGWTRSAVRNAIRTGRIVPLRRGVYCCESEAGQPSAILAAVAAARAYPHATISHRSALLVATLPLLGPPPVLPELTVPPRASVTMPRVHPHRATVRAEDRTVVHGVAVTTTARTLVDVARNNSVDAAVVAMDAALHRRLVTRDDIGHVLDSCRNWPMIRRARQSFELADGRSESPLESVSRLAFPRLGLPVPLPQVDVLDQYGTFLGRCDFGWDGLGVVGEADGLAKYRDPEDLVSEKLRQEAIERTGLVVVRWGWDEAWRWQTELRRRVLGAVERADARDRARQPRRWVFRRATVGAL